ncbi:AIPR family protein [uncultured Bradyrhizobium sp.]|jgi:ribosomal protein L20|uniref:AIPR family protein n=1 Tax=uncultured Bradyrhizobium sp. TaxID=199684 RepID=UPI0026142C21|nr:AIPR family protein [uncultured Bradyrhizobium sp.]
MPARVDISTLTAEVREIHDQYPNWTTDNAFVHWFLQAFLLNDVELAAKAVTGVSHDKGVDGIYLDESLRRAFLVQGKFHKNTKPPNEPRSGVLDFAALARKLVAPNAEFESYRNGLDPLVAKKILEVRDRVKRRNFEIGLYYVTTGVCSSPLKDEAEAEANQANARASMTVLDREEILNLLVDYLGGAAPPVPYLDLPVDARGVRGSDGMIQRFDPEAGIESWILTMSGSDLGKLYKRGGDRLFARNVRGFLGDKGINEGIRTTLQKEPENFWYFNNGVTIVCNSARKTSEHAQAVLRVTNPQIINGQQTTRVLSLAKSNAAAVVVRVISVPRTKKRQQSEFEMLVSNIVAATNWQNAILNSDLRSNDARQVLLEREFAKLKYRYMRKRQTKGEARRLLGSHYGFWVKMDELAQLVGACELDPYITRSGKQGLFEPPYYEKIFDNRSVENYLSIFWLGKVIKSAGSGYPDRAYAKWHALHFLWSHTRPALSRLSYAREFRRLSERKQAPASILRAANQIFLALLEFYRLNRGTGKKAIDISNFFYRPHQDREFKKFWFGRTNAARRGRLAMHVAAFKKTLQTSASDH